MEQNDLDQIAEVADAFGDAAEIAGVEDVAAGIEEIAVAGELEEASKDALTSAAVDIAHGFDDLNLPPMPPS